MSRTGRTTSGLALGSILSGLLAYVLFAVVTQGLGAEAAAPLSVLWTFWAFAGAALTFPVQHWVARLLATEQVDVLRSAAGRVGVTVVVAALTSGLVAWLLREPLFGRTDAWFPSLVVLVALGSALMGLLRGVAGGRRRFGVVALSLVAENALRCVAAAGLLVAGVDDPVAYGLALAAGPAVAVLWWPTLPVARHRQDPASRSDRAPSGAVVGLTSAASVQVVAQVVLTGAPVLVALTGGAPAAVTALFATLALFRAPYLVALGAVPQLTVLVAQRTGAGRRPLALTATAVLSGSLAVVLLVILAAAFGALVGPSLVPLVFGSTVQVSAAEAGLVAAGCVVAVVNLVLVVVALAQDRAGAALAAWVPAVLVAVVLGLGLAWASQGATAVALGSFLAAEVTALLGLAFAALRPAQPRGL
jgi:hypothetical protein